MLPVLAFLLGLPLTLASPTCAPLIPVTFDNATVTRLLGPWIYIAGASRYPPHLEELKALKHAAFSFSPSSHEDELNVIEIMRLNETCLERNTSKVLVFQHNSTLAHVDDQVFAMAKLIQSDKDLLILNHLNDDFPSLSLSGERTLPRDPWGTSVARDASVSMTEQKAPSLMWRGVGMQRSPHLHYRHHQGAKHPQTSLFLPLPLFPPHFSAARTPNVTKEQLEEFRSHLHCLGFTEEDIFFTSEKDACPLPWEKKGEGDVEPQLK
ncbi:alpha-1-acid glycoprotein 1-like isoform 2-T2 [Ara ararauna]